MFRPVDLKKLPNFFNKQKKIEHSIRIFMLKIKKYILNNFWSKTNLIIYRILSKNIFTYIYTLFYFYKRGHTF